MAFKKHIPQNMLTQQYSIINNYYHYQY